MFIQTYNNSDFDGLLDQIDCYMEAEDPIVKVLDDELVITVSFKEYKIMYKFAMLYHGGYLFIKDSHGDRIFWYNYDEEAIVRLKSLLGVTL